MANQRRYNVLPGVHPVARGSDKFCSKDIPHDNGECNRQCEPIQLRTWGRKSPSDKLNRMQFSFN